MPLQNRVDPFGDIHAADARGLFTGNRGIIHDPATKTLLKRRWTTKAWIVCTCDYKGRRRDVMGRNGPNGGAGWTELFFLDEVTALSAGHRPCFTCQRERAKEFCDCFARGRGLASIAAPAVDRVLHGERRASGGTPRKLTPAEAWSLPDGAMVAQGGLAFAVHGDWLVPWFMQGYGRICSRAGVETDDTSLLTPPATVAAIRAGYRPIWSATLRDFEANAAAIGPDI
ncbi:hypothetical protein [Mesorhizobium marinum]|uniref:Uncharacterized protein n=1 Tax=Mesorhizobium marinum TaxID=3228790 RepID=A0ABV3R302_9HYPH